MEKYVLQHDEYYIIRKESVTHNNSYGELILTNKYLAFVTTKGMFFKKYIVQRYPFVSDSVSDGIAQAILGKNGEFYFFSRKGKKTFSISNSDLLFSNKKAEKEANTWVAAINQQAERHPPIVVPQM